MSDTSPQAAPQDAPQVGQVVADDDLHLTGDRHVRLSDYRGRWLVLFFYPKASTPGCTQEGQDFRDAYADFVAAGAEILGASRDGLKAQQNFKAKHQFPFDLLADPEQHFCHAFQVIKPKTLFGKPVTGIQRSTFLIDPQGVLRQEWRKVKVEGHVSAVLEALRSLSGA